MYVLRTLTIAALALVLICSAGMAQGSGKVLLQWKVPSDGALILHETSTGAEETIRGAAPMDSDQLAAGIGHKGDSLAALFPRELNMRPANYIVLRPTRGGTLSAMFVVDTAVASHPATTAKEKKALEEMAASGSLVQLRGIITRTGAIASFYLDNRLKNSLALNLQLPPDSVSVGQIWPMDVSLLSINDPRVAISEARRTNLGRLAGLRNEGGDVVATIEFVIAESLRGGVPGGEVVKLGSMAFVGRGEFLVNKGTWRQLTTRMRVQSTAGGTSEQVARLVPATNAPAWLAKVQ